MDSPLLTDEAVEAAQAHFHPDPASRLSSVAVHCHIEGFLAYCATEGREALVKESKQVALSHADLFGNYNVALVEAVAEAVIGHLFPLGGYARIPEREDK